MDAAEEDAANEDAAKKDAADVDAAHEAMAETIAAALNETAAAAAATVPSTVDIARLDAGTIAPNLLADAVTTRSARASMPSREEMISEIQWTTPDFF